MSRPLRIEFPGAVQHVTSRGDRREPIYADDEHREAHPGEVAAPNWLDVDAVAGHLLGREPKHSADRRRARQRPAQLLGAAQVEGSEAAFSRADALRRQIFLGNDEFVARVQAQMSAGQALAADIPKSQRRATLSLQDCLDRAPDRNSAIAKACRGGWDDDDGDRQGDGPVGVAGKPGDRWA
jgi:hypothetical protein